MTDSRPVVFLDFDGTISRCDVVDAILEAYADPGWLQIEATWQAGGIGSRECLRAQMSLVRATRASLDRLLDGRVVWRLVRRLARTAPVLDGRGVRRGRLHEEAVCTRHRGRGLICGEHGSHCR